MIYIKRLIGTVLALAVMLCCASCADTEESIESGELVVVEDNSDIRLGIYGVDTLNPLETKSESVRKIMNIVYEPLFEKGEDMSSVPVLAESFSVSDGGSRIMVRLKSGVKWQNGTVFTADDVVYTLSKMRSSGGYYGKISKKIKRFTAVDKNSVVINFEKAEPNPELLLMFPVVPRGNGYSADADFAPIGTGSYKLSSRSSTELILEPNALWHGGEAAGKRIVVKILKNEAAAAEAFNVNGIDAVTSDELSLESASPKGSSRFETIVSDNMVFLGFNTKSAALEAVGIRKAIAALVDKEKLLENDAYGHGKVSDSAVNPASKVSFELPEAEEDYAENLINGEGYELSGGTYCKDSLPLHVRILANSENTVRTAIADSIAEMLRTSGFSVAVEKVTYEEYTAKIASDDFDMFVGEVETEQNLNPASMLETDNYFNFDVSPLGEYVGALADAAGGTEYKSAVESFMKKFYADPPYVPIYFRTESVIYGDYVSGTEKPSVYNPYKNTEKWYFYNKDGVSENGENSDE